MIDEIGVLLLKESNLIYKGKIITAQLRGLHHTTYKYTCRYFGQLERIWSNYKLLVYYKIQEKD